MATLRTALLADTAEWLDARMRHLESDDPTAYWAEQPSLNSWQRGGHIWATTLRTVPDAALLGHLAARYSDPQPEGPALLRAAATDALGALAIAADPASTEMSELGRAWRMLDRLTFTTGADQVIQPARSARDALLDHLLSRHRHPETATVLATPPDAHGEHPAREAARAYLTRLNRIGPAVDADLLNDIRADFDDTLRELDDAQPPRDAPAPAPAAPVVGAVPGFPVQLGSDLQAAAAWRAKVPTARHEAEKTQGALTRAADALTEITAHHAPEQPLPLPQRQSRDRIMDQCNDLRSTLTNLDAQHAALTYLSVLADAEHAAESALALVITTEHEKRARPTAGRYTREENDAWGAALEAGERAITDIVSAQRRLTRDALHRLFPRQAGPDGGRALRRQMIDNAGLGGEEFQRVYDRIPIARRHLDQLQRSYNSPHVEFGKAPVTAAQVDQAREHLKHTEHRFENLRRDRPATLRAVRLLEAVMELKPTPTGGLAALATYAEHLSHGRSKSGSAPPAEATPAVRPADHAHGHALQQRGAGPASRLP
ncbi:hypothetical protein ABZW18_32660 [Streptomyces sp. NPDC004647]|uniref:hypothetical protein n=1 Tax=Streptomyces sp. NPDC004647 TaxID=3154671 RepID=UPI0033BE42EC